MTSCICALTATDACLSPERKPLLLGQTSGIQIVGAPLNCVGLRTLKIAQFYQKNPLSQSAIFVLKELLFEVTLE
jgi:hypothetical protein